MLGMLIIQRPFPDTLYYSIQVSPGKYTRRYGDYWHSKRVTLRTHSMHGVYVGAFDSLFSLCYVLLVLTKC